MAMMSRAKLAVIAVLVTLFLVLVLQNTEPVETRILFATLSMPRAALLAAAGVLGFLIGLLVAFRISARKTPS